MPISLAQIESDWTLRDDASSLINNISGTKQSNLLLLHFLSEQKTVCQVISQQQYYSV